MYAIVISTMCLKGCRQQQLRLVKRQCRAHLGSVDGESSHAFGACVEQGAAAAWGRQQRRLGCFAAWMAGSSSNSSLSPPMIAHSMIAHSMMARPQTSPGLAASDDGALCASISRDGTVKVGGRLLKNTWRLLRNRLAVEEPLCGWHTSCYGRQRESRFCCGKRL